MTLTRRDFSILAAATAAASHPFSKALASHWQEPLATSVFDWRQINDHMFVAFEHGGNALLARTPDATILVDSKNAGFGPSLKREATAKLAMPDILINTHHHGDHTGGNESFTATADVYAQHNAAQRIKDQYQQIKQRIPRLQTSFNDSESPAADLMRKDFEIIADRADSISAENFAPNHTILQESGHTEIVPGVEAGHVTPSHTDNDMAIFFPQHNVLHMGDLLFHELHPFIRLTDGASTEGWTESLEHILSDVCNEQTIVIPGHGQITDHTGIKTQINYFKQNRDIVSRAIEQGSSRDDITALQPEHSSNYGFQGLREIVLGAIYDELTTE